MLLITIFLQSRKVLMKQGIKSLASCKNHDGSSTCQVMYQMSKRILAGHIPCHSKSATLEAHVRFHIHRENLKGMYNFIVQH